MQHVMSSVYRYFCAKDPICGRMEKNSNLYIVASGKVNFELSYESRSSSKCSSRDVYVDQG